jgi:hypothetical protein
VNLDVIAFFIVFPALAMTSGAYLTALLCRRELHRIRWYWALFGTLASGLLMAMLVWLGLSLPSGGMGKVATVWELMQWAFVLACGCALIPAALSVWYYRRRFRKGGIGSITIRPKPDQNRLGID